VDAGNVEVVLHNDGAVLHDLRIEDQPFVIEAGPGTTGPARSRWKRAATSCSARSLATVRPA
jgi:hypothetical protein